MSKIGALTNLANKYTVSALPLTAETLSNFSFKPNQLIIGSHVNGSHNDTGSVGLFATDEEGHILQLTYSMDMSYFKLLENNTITLDIDKLKNALGI